jgi:hypothetical protein
MVMSDRRDDGPLRLPAEREVPPQLRARVLHQAVRDDHQPARRPTRIGPVLAGLAAAAVVVGVVYAVGQSADRGGSGKDDIAGNDITPGSQVTPHDVVETVVRVPGDQAIGGVQRECRQATGVDASLRMATQILRSPLGRIESGAYALTASADHTQIFCTPFAQITSRRDDNMVTAQSPVAFVANSRVQGTLPTRNDAQRVAYYDGAWVSVTSSVQSVEVRLVVDGVPQTWHAAKRYHGFMFAATWEPLTEDQASSAVTVEYRAISVDDRVLPMPSDLRSSTVVPDQTPALNDRQTILPGGGD